MLDNTDDNNNNNNKDNNYGGIIDNCREQIHHLFSAVAYKNEKIALRFLSIKVVIVINHSA
jgi:hypothetical protein